MPKVNKIVYILGAGFSQPCGMPQQNEILPKILEQALNIRLKNFLTSFFGHSENVTLEDIFTVLDKSINKNEALGRFDRKELHNIRDDFTNGIVRLFKELKPTQNPNYIDIFSEKLLKFRFRDRQKDTLAVISTNWDVLLDNTLKTEMHKDWAKEENKRIAFIDYCTFTRSLDHEENIPSTQLKARGYVNFKLLKLHGSVGWHLCPNCDSLFVDSQNNSLFRTRSEIVTCKMCRKNYCLKINTNHLVVSPTFIKNFNNVHFSNIWWNAGFELSEATHIVFIGYSLPLSDFELRYLFARSILKKNTKIKVILFSKNPSRPNRNAQITSERYVYFFGNMINKKRDISFHGVESYVKNLHGENLFW